MKLSIFIILSFFSTVGLASENYCTAKITVAGGNEVLAQRDCKGVTVIEADCMYGVFINNGGYSALARRDCKGITEAWEAICIVERISFNGGYGALARKNCIQ